MRLHAIIISWEGYFDKAHAIATALAGSVDALTVIYSNAAETPQTGPGTWVQVPQSWYFGRKFRASLDMVGPDDLMLQIQADAHSDDWPALAARCAQCFATHRDIALWTPDVNWSPWHAQVVGDGMIAQTGLLRVRQTDGIVWALHPVLYPVLRAPEYDSNNLGWGIDWLAMLTADQHAMIAVRDMTCPVDHPYARGYPNAPAAQHMKNFLSQLPPADQRAILIAHDTLDARKQAFAGRLPPPSQPPSPAIPPTPETTLMPWPFFRAPTAVKLSEAFVIAGHVYVKAAGRDVQARATIQSGGVASPLTLMHSNPPYDRITRGFPLHAVDSKTAYQQLDGLKEWQVDGWHTLRVIPDFTARRQTITLSGDTMLMPADGPQIFTANLAVHRGKGNLVVRLSDTTGTPVHEHRCRFDTANWGGEHAEHYKHVQIALEQSDQPLRLTLHIETEETPETTRDQPAVFFVARPRLRGAGKYATLAPAITQARKPRGDAVWYAATLGPAPQPGVREVALVAGKTRVPLLSVPDVRITLTRDHGHMLELHADCALSVSVWLAGAPCFVMALETGGNTLHLPAVDAAGAPALLELRDTSGTLLLWHTWVVPHAQTLPLPASGIAQRDLLSRRDARMAALRQHLANPADPALLPQLDTVLTALEAGPDARMFTPLRFGTVATPDVTVIITSHTELSVTYACLAALLLAWNSASLEVIVVAPARSGAAHQIEDLVDGITVLPSDLSGAVALNAAAAQARATHIALLDSAIEVTSGWLDTLIAAFEEFADVGCAGAKILGPDGRILAAGGLVTPAQGPRPYGAGQNPDDPRVSYARQVDYLPRSALMISKTAWSKAGGLKADPAGTDFEDAALASRVRDAGLATWYVSAASVYCDALPVPDIPPQGAEVIDPDPATDLAKDRRIEGRVVVLTHHTPAWDDIRLIRSSGYKVTFGAQEMALPPADISALCHSGVEVITPPFYSTLEDFITARGREFDILYIVGCDLAHSIVPGIRATHPLARLVLRTTDADTSTTLSEHTLGTMRSVDVVLSHSAPAHALITADSGDTVTVMHGDAVEGAFTQAGFRKAGPPAD